MICSLVPSLARQVFLHSSFHLLWRKRSRSSEDLHRVKTAHYSTHESAQLSLMRPKNVHPLFRVRFSHFSELIRFVSCSCTFCFCVVRWITCVRPEFRSIDAGSLASSSNWAKKPTDHQLSALSWAFFEKNSFKRVYINKRGISRANQCDRDSVREKNVWEFVSAESKIKNSDARDFRIVVVSLKR